MGLFLSFSVFYDEVSSILYPSRSATSRSESKCNTGRVLTPHSVHRAKYFYVVRLGAMLLSPHVAVEPLDIRRVGAIVL